MIKEIRNRIPISSVVSKFLKLQKKGRLMWGLCPFHGEKTPSFVVNDEKQMFHCFGCGISGDIFKFLQLKEERSFGDIVNELSLSCGLGKVVLKKCIPLENVMVKALEFYEKSLVDKSYLYSRNLNDEIIKKFQLGFAPNSEIINFLYEFFDAQTLTEAGILTMNSLDRFRDRIIIPIKNRQNLPIGFAGRAITDIQPKYLNSMETPIFKKSLHLFGEQFLDSTVNIGILVEGYLDVIKMYAHGYKNVFGTMGTSMNKSHFLTLFYSLDIVFIMLDGDSAGIRAIHNNIHILLGSIKPGKHINIVELPEKDPDSILDNSGKERLDFYISQGKPLYLWVYDNILEKYNSGNDRPLYLQKISEISQMISNEFMKIDYVDRWKKMMNNSNNIIKISEKLTTNNYNEEILLSILLNHLIYLEYIIDKICYISFKNKVYNDIFLYIIDNLAHENIETIENHIKNTWKIKAKSTIKFLSSDVLYCYISDIYNKIQSSI